MKTRAPAAICTYRLLVVYVHFSMWDDSSSVTVPTSAPAWLVCFRKVTRRISVGLFCGGNFIALMTHWFQSRMLVRQTWTLTRIENFRNKGMPQNFPRLLDAFTRMYIQMGRRCSDASVFNLFLTVQPKISRPEYRKHLQMRLNSQIWPTQHLWERSEITSCSSKLPAVYKDLLSVAGLCFALVPTIVRNTSIKKEKAAVRDFEGLTTLARKKNIGRSIWERKHLGYGVRPGSSAGIGILCVIYTAYITTYIPFTKSRGCLCRCGWRRTLVNVSNNCRINGWSCLQSIQWEKYHIEAEVGGCDCQEETSTTASAKSTPTTTTTIAIATCIISPQQINQRVAREGAKAVDSPKSAITAQSCSSNCQL